MSLKRPKSAEGRLRERTGGLRLESQEEAGTLECGKRGECAGDDTGRGECRGFTAICENSFDRTVRGVGQRGAVADAREDEECADVKARGGVTGWEGKCCCRERGEPRKRTGVVADDGGDDDDEAKGEAAEGADVEQRECSATARSSSERA